MNINNGIKNFNFLNLNNIDFSKICYKKLFKDGHLSTLILLENHVDFVKKNDEKKFFLNEETVIKYTLSALYKNKINVCKYFLDNHLTQNMCNRLVKESLIAKNKDLFMYIIHNFDEHICYEMIRYCINNSKEIFDIDCYNNFNVTNLSHFDGLISSMKNDDLTLFRYYEKFIDYDKYYKNYYHIAFNNGSSKILKYLFINNKIDKNFVKEYYKTMNIKRFTLGKFRRLFDFIIKYKLLSDRKIYKSIKKYNNKIPTCEYFYMFGKEYYDELKSQNKLDLCEKYKMYFEDDYVENDPIEKLEIDDLNRSFEQIFKLLLVIILIWVFYNIIICVLKNYTDVCGETENVFCSLCESNMRFINKLGFLLKF